jgi:hypothetical protein
LAEAKITAIFGGHDRLITDNSKPVIGHLAAFGTILIWGTTFVSTKILLKSCGLLFFDGDADGTFGKYRD